MTAAKALDFVVVGAIKGGTTALFHWLRSDARIYLPPGKEQPYFSRDDYFAAGWPAFAAERYVGAREEQCWGGVNPAYMADPVVPERMAEEMPKTRLVAVLRHPVDRAVSEWRMMQRKGAESRPLEDALRAALDGTTIAYARAGRFDPLSTRSYVSRGEYGRVLSTFAARFPRESMLVVTSESLKKHPEEIFGRVQRHLGLEPRMQANVGKEYHRGGSQRFPGFLSRLRRVAPLRWAWGRLSPALRRDALIYWHTELNVRPETPPELGPVLRAELEAHFRADLRELPFAADELRGSWGELVESASGGQVRNGDGEGESAR